MKTLTEYMAIGLSENPVFSKVFEMAYSRKDLQKRVIGLCHQITENWVLIKYAGLSGNTLNKNHWKKELSSYLYNIFDMNYKGDKYGLIEDIFFNKEELNKTERIEYICYKKIKRENIKPDDKYYIKACSLFSEDIINIIKLISSDNTNDNFDRLYDYIDSL